MFFRWVIEIYLHLQSISVNVAAPVSGPLFLKVFPEFRHSTEKRIAQKICVFSPNTCWDPFALFPNHWTHCSAIAINSDSPLIEWPGDHCLYSALFRAKYGRSGEGKHILNAYFVDWDMHKSDAIKKQKSTTMYRFKIAPLHRHLSHDIFRIENWFQIHPRWLHF